MLKQANDKIMAEMIKNPDAYTQAVGNYLLTHLKCYPADAEKVLADGKTIRGSLEKMRNVAQGKQVNRCAMFTPDEGFGIVLEYFGINVAGATTAPQPAPKAAEFDINLDDLLG